MTKRLPLSSTVKSRRLSLFGHVARMVRNAVAKYSFTADGELEETL